MKLILPLVLMVSGLTGLLAMGIMHGGVPEMQVHEFLDGRHEDRTVKVHGIISAIHSDVRPLRFTVADKADASLTMEVLGLGTRPDTFAQDREVAVMGRLERGSGVFKASQVFTKCPSKYEGLEGLDEEEGSEGEAGPPGYAAPDRPAR